MKTTNDPHKFSEEKISEEVKEIEVKDETTVKGKNVTAKTLKAWNEQCDKIIEQKLVNEEEAEALKKIKESVKNNFIKTIF